ncbi:TPA: hypothetical protein HA242_04585 [Candidatus Woesearchaeota archaeon]|nr:hypothetical protein [Candidatus Woesearchaeota archaeon]HIG93715.1 hypothetical protein [Candidatus Woesearchaeota archaeon]HIH12975.1 hypothetical protein [Candidatus Woesearchaeota archaeon]
MGLKSVQMVRIQDMTLEQKKELGVVAEKGLVAIETHNSEYTTKAVTITNGIVNYILTGN